MSQHDYGGDLGWPYIPHYPLVYTQYISWDGRINFEPGAPTQVQGHLADPELGPYTAFVYAQNTPPEGDNLFSNCIEFAVVPKIDSILLTHYPSFPPPTQGQTTELYSIIRGKVDDSGSPAVDYRFFSPPGVPETFLEIWDGQQESCNFRDLPTDQQRFYYEDNSKTTIGPLREWKTYLWGNIDYKWIVVHDWRDYISGQRQVIVYDYVDTTQFWGNDWVVSLSPPNNWDNRKTIPYMRLLVKNQISNSQNSHLIQTNISADDGNAHKVIFTTNTGDTDFSILDWAISHIGVPFYVLSGPDNPREPYGKIDCSGFVTAAKIQLLGSENNQNFIVKGPSSYNYLQGQYSFEGETYSTETTIANPDLVDIPEGSLLCTIARHQEEEDTYHVGIIAWLNWNRVTHKAINLWAIQEVGGPGPTAGRVVYSDVAKWQEKYDIVYLKWNR
jgi:hypothetical protein